MKERWCPKMARSRLSRPQRHNTARPHFNKFARMCALPLQPFVQWEGPPGSGADASCALLARARQNSYSVSEVHRNRGVRVGPLGATYAALLQRQAAPLAVSNGPRRLVGGRQRFDSLGREALGMTNCASTPRLYSLTLSALMPRSRTFFTIRRRHNSCRTR